MNQRMLDILQEHEAYMQGKYGSACSLAYGTAHIVYGDYNLDDHSIMFCIGRTEELQANLNDPNRPAYCDNYDDEDNLAILEDILWLLSILWDIPEYDRQVYD